MKIPRRRRKTPLGTAAKVLNLYALAKAVSALRQQRSLAKPGAVALGLAAGAGALALARRRRAQEEYAGVEVQDPADLEPRETPSNVAEFRTVDAG